MPDPTNPTIISAIGFMPGGVWKYVYAIYEVRNQTPLSLNQIICKLKDSDNLEFVADPNPYFETISSTSPDFVYRIHLRLRPPASHSTANAPITGTHRLKGLEDMTFSIELNVGSIYPPPTEVTQPIQIIEIDPCPTVTSARN